MKVSVMIITYNHECYVAQAIESALMQKTNFPFEVVIGEDCSTDATREIVKRYARDHPSKIRPLLRERNIGFCANYRRTLSECRGQYVAMLNDDDYWTSPEKLQKQVDFLDQHPECALCYHNAMRIYEDGSHVPLPYNLADQKEISSLEDLWQYNFIATCTAMFRKNAVGELPDWYSDIMFGDWPLFILCAQHGKIGYIDECLGVYRIHSGGVWSRLDSFQKLEARIAFYETMNAKLDFRFNHIVEPLVSARRKELAAARSIAEIVERTLPPAAVVLVMSMANQDLRQFQGYQARVFPDRSSKPTQRLFASGSAGSTEAPWIAAGGTYEFRLYRGPAQNELLASVTVTQNAPDLCSPHSEEEPHKSGPFIEASPNPVPSGTEFAKTTISWATGDGSPGAVYVFVNDRRIQYPTDSAEAIEQLQTLRAKGGEFLLVPHDAFGLLERYPELKEHLEQHHQLLASKEDTCLIYDLREAPDMVKG
jgi:glycosyltransferase involved in cell wall biosynthesis/ribosomal protein S15P/S13E